MNQVKSTQAAPQTEPQAEHDDQRLTSAAMLLVEWVLSVIEESGTKPQDDQRRGDVQIDAELHRELIALGYSAESLVYAVAQQVTRNSGGSGKLSVESLIASLHDAGMQWCDQHVRKVLRRGDGKFWDYCPDYREGAVLFVYAPQRKTTHGIRGRLRIAEMSIAAGRADVLAANPPGSAYVTVTIPRTLKQWEARVYAAWLRCHGDDTKMISVSRLNAFGTVRVIPCCAGKNWRIFNPQPTTPNFMRTANSFQTTPSLTSCNRTDRRRCAPLHGCRTPTALQKLHSATSTTYRESAALPSKQR